ncbi:MAG: glycosyltransferase family 4 protein [Thermoplasmata archaeon]|nr:glycosyltransferase family 4 protein [Thermoplasmata archaeon]
MRIAQVSLRFDAPGGVETTVRELSRRLRTSGDDVTVYASDLYDEGRWERRSRFAPNVDGVPVERFPVYRRLVPGVTMPLMVGLIGALARDRPEVIHAHSHRYGHVLECALVARALRIPLVVSTHYHPADRREPVRKRALLRLQDVLFGASAYRIASALVAETALEAGLLGGFAPSERIHIIPPGIDLGVWRNASVGARPDSLPSRYLLYAGRIAPNKGLEVLLHALALVPPPDRLPLVLVGRDWGERPRLEALARLLGIEAYVSWMGYVADPDEYQSMFRGAAAFVLPSEWEAFGLVLLEAMASGVPIIATSVGGVPEVLDRGRVGRLVPHGSPKALAEALHDVVRSPGTFRPGVDAARTWVDRFSWERCVAAHRRVYALLAGVRAA